MAAFLGVVVAAGTGATCAGNYSEPASTPDRTYASSESVSWQGTYKGRVDTYQTNGSVAHDQPFEVTIELIDAGAPIPYWEVAWSWLRSGVATDWNRVRVTPDFSRSSSSYRGRSVSSGGVAANLGFTLSGDRLTATVVWGQRGAPSDVSQGRAEGVLTKEP